MSANIKVITTGPFMLLDPHNGTEIEPETETEVVETSFIKDRIELGHLKLVVKKAPAK